MRQDLGRRHHRCLRARVGRCGQCVRRNQCLAGADVAEQHAVHRLRLVHVGQDLADASTWSCGQLERDGRLQLAEKRAVDRMREAGVLSGERVSPKRHVELQLKDLVVGEPMAGGAASRRCRAGTGCRAALRRAASVRARCEATPAGGRVPRRSRRSMLPPAAAASWSTAPRWRGAPAGCAPHSRPSPRPGASRRTAPGSASGRSRAPPCPRRPDGRRPRTAARCRAG